MQYKKNLLLCLVAALAMAGCDGDDNPFDAPFGEFRVANAISDSNPIDAEIEGLPSDINDITFGTASSLRDFPQGNYRVTLRSTTQSGTVEWVNDPTNIDEDEMTTLYAVGRLGNQSQSTHVVKAPDTEVGNNQTEAQFVHVASQTPETLDIYLTAPNLDVLTTSTPTATLSYKTNNPPGFFTPGNYRIRVTPQGDKTTILFDSGPGTGVSLPAATTQQFALIDNPNSSASSELIVLGLKGTGESFQVQDVP